MSLFGISSVELVVILVVTVLVLGPSGFAEALRGFRRGVETFRAWSGRLREESSREPLGLDGVDLSALDLRQYDPREIVRRTVREEINAWMQVTDVTRAGSPPRSGNGSAAAGPKDAG